MPKKGKKKLVLDRIHIQAIRAVAPGLGPLTHALFEWIYTNGSRASEPGMAKLADLSLQTGHAQLVHLKGGLDPEFIELAPPCRRALETWLTVRKTRLVSPEQHDFVFPSRTPGPCYPCSGTGSLKRKVKRKNRSESVEGPCHHCRGTGKRWGLSRHEVRHLMDSLMEQAGIPQPLRFPHILRHSMVSHLLDKGVPPTAIQERVGHKAIETTYGYMKTTEKARRQIMDALDEE